MAEIIDLKQIVLDFDTKNPANRYHALEILNYIERCENLVVNPEEKVYNGISFGDLAIMKLENM